MSLPLDGGENRTLKVFSFNVWGLAFISKDRPERVKAIAAHLGSSDFDIVCLQELWIYKDFEIVREEVRHNLPFSRFFHTGALGSGLAIFTRFPLISAQALPYSLSGSPHQATAGDFFVKKAAANVVVLHPLLGELEIWNTHMHAAGENPPDTRQAHRIAQSWQLANEIRGGAARGRYILAMGDFNSQPGSLPIAILRSHASLNDSFLSTHPQANTSPTLPPSHHTALSTYGMTCDSPINTYSQGKPIPHEVSSRGGKRLDYIFYRQPEVARRRPLIWGYRDNSDHSAGYQGAGHIEEGKPLQQSLSSAPKLRCLKSEVVMTERVPGQSFSFSDHFGVLSIFHIEDSKPKAQASQDSSTNPTAAGAAHGSFNPLVPLMTEPEPLSDTTTTFAPIDPRGPTSPLSSTSSISLNAKSSCIRSALNTLRMYTRIAQQTSRSHLRYFVTAVICLLGLTIGSAWQPRSWIQPIFTLLGGALGAGGATMLYTGFVWGRWEEGILKEVIEEMELELRVVEMEENAGRS